MKVKSFEKQNIYKKPPLCPPDDCQWCISFQKYSAAQPYPKKRTNNPL